jgi:TfoX/Sxy family transcriptional regulator of competence genes
MESTMGAILTAGELIVRGRDIDASDLRSVPEWYKVATKGRENRGP